MTLAWEETISLEEGGEVQHLEALTVSPEGTQVTTYVDYSQGALGHVALTDNASGVTALSWVRTGSSEVDLQVAAAGRDRRPLRSPATASPVTSR